MGGVRNGIEYFNALRELKKIKEEHRQHDLQIEHSYHAAEITHAFIEKTSDTISTTTSWALGAQLTSGNFTSGRKYLILACGFHSGFNTSDIAQCRVSHGSSVEFGTSRRAIEPNATSLGEGCHIFGSLFGLL